MDGLTRFRWVRKVVGGVCEASSVHPLGRLAGLAAFVWRQSFAPYTTSLFLVAGLAVGGLAFLVTRNLLNIAYGMMVYVAVVALVSSRSWRLAALAFLVATTLFSVNRPMQEMRHINNLLEMAPFAPDEARAFTFDLIDFARRQEQCGSFEGAVLIQGKDLAGLAIEVEGGELSDATPRGFYSYQRLLLPIRPTAGTVRLRFTAKKGHHPQLLLGAEISGNELYPQAVYLSFTNRHCRIIYHAKPEISRGGSR